MWKANGLGVDLNRNFDAAWKSTSGRVNPSSERYKGTQPLSAAESAALAAYTIALMPDVTISWHSTGSVIYYEYGKKKAVNAASKSLGQAVEAVSGYPLIGFSGLDAAGYKDWCMDTLEIPSLTMELGCGACPLPEREIYSIFARNIRVMPAISQWIEQQK
jgi:g-D-glutamyl-meso-diaminopimelate peptidase